MFLTKEVFIFPKFIFCKFEQPENIRSILVTLEALKLDKSISIKFTKPLNISLHDSI